MKFSLIADITIRIDEEAYAQDVGAMWDDHEALGTPEPSLPSGYGQCTQAVERLSAALATALGLEWECCSYADVQVTLSGDGAQGYMADKYREYESKLVHQLAVKGLDKWAKVRT